MQPNFVAAGALEDRAERSGLDHHGWKQNAQQDFVQVEGLKSGL